MTYVSIDTWKDLMTKTTAKGGLESLENYKLPVCDVTKERRNFDGGPIMYHCDLPVPDENITSGTTETDSKTDPRQPNYSSAYRESGKPLSSHKGKQLSTKALGRGR